MRSIRSVLLASLLLAVAGCSLVGCDSGPGECDLCRRQIHKATLYRIHLDDGTVRQTCCPRCGLHFEEGRQDVVRREVADFASGELMKAEDAIYVEGSSVHLCCSQMDARDQSGRQYALHWDRCMPSLIGFRSAEAAEQFRQQKGGAVKSFAQLSTEPQG